MIPALVLLSAFLHALWNALLRVEPDKDRGLVGAVTVASLFAAMIAGARWVAGGEPPFPTGAALGYTLLGGAFEAVYFATLAQALERGRLGTVYTVSRGGAVLAVWPLSIAWFAEVVTPTSAAGSVVVLGGLVLSGFGAPGQTARHRSGVWYAAACAIAIAGYHLAYKAALGAGGSPSATFALSLGLAAAISIVRLGSTGRAVLWRLAVHARRARIALMGAFCGGSFLILMEALARGGSGYVLTLRNTSVLFAAALAFTIGERPARAELAGAALVAGGAVLMSI
jgi:uncharacterized membrane protein